MKKSTEQSHLDKILLSVPGSSICADAFSARFVR